MFVGITTARTIESGGVLRHQLPVAYTQALLPHGLMPLLIPSDLSIEALRSLYERMDGILLSGGGDVSPERYGGPWHERVYGVDPLRDETELHLIEWALADDKALLGICRGLQILNVALGGSLIGDIPSEVGSEVLHSLGGEAENRPRLLHSVSVEPNSRLHQISGQGEFAVNSIHHQGIQRLADRLKPSAYAPDGVVEAVEVPEAHFVMAVQWHPEEIVAHSASAPALFAAFAEAL